MKTLDKKIPKSTKLEYFAPPLKSFKSKMFYQADAIDGILICKICDNKMVDPRLLPCGRSVCHRCVDLIADTDKKRIKCQNCAKIHVIPDDGFLKNLTIQELLEFEAK